MNKRGVSLTVLGDFHGHRDDTSFQSEFICIYLNGVGQKAAEE
jgi:hypothetical protein